jgi:hypothetical protein
MVALLLLVHLDMFVHAKGSTWTNVCVVPLSHILGLLFKAATKKNKTCFIMIAKKRSAFFRAIIHIHPKKSTSTCKTMSHAELIFFSIQQINKQQKPTTPYHHVSEQCHASST